MKKFYDKLVKTRHHLHQHQSCLAKNMKQQPF